MIDHAFYTSPTCLNLINRDVTGEWLSIHVKTQPFLSWGLSKLHILSKGMTKAIILIIYYNLEEDHMSWSMQCLCYIGVEIFVSKNDNFTIGH